MATIAVDINLLAQKVGDPRVSAVIALNKIVAKCEAYTNFKLVLSGGYKPELCCHASDRRPSRSSVLL